MPTRRIAQFDLQAVQMPKILNKVNEQVWILRNVRYTGVVSGSAR
jgi:hypothetical protein